MPFLLLFSEYSKYQVRFVDRDMLMRFHYGLAVGHSYSHYQAPRTSGTPLPDSDEPCSSDDIGIERAESSELRHNDWSDSDPVIDTPGLDLEFEDDCNEDDEDDLGVWEDDDGEGSDGRSEDSDTLLGLEEMYGDRTMEMDYEN
jgi:hypothetical protein